MQRQQPSASASNQETPAEVFGRRLREERTARGISQDRLADLVSAELGPDAPKLHGTGVTRIESGRQSVSLNQAVTIAAVLELDLAALLEASGQMSATDALVRAEAHLADLEHQERMVATERRIASTRVDRLKAIVRQEEQD